MRKKRSIQYTLRGIPERADMVLREKAVRDRKSLNEAALEALSHGLGVSEETPVYTDMDDLAGTWVKSPAFDRLLRDMDKVDEDLWK